MVHILCDEFYLHSSLQDHINSADQELPICQFQQTSVHLINSDFSSYKIFIETGVRYSQTLKASWCWMRLAAWSY